MYVAVSGHDHSGCRLPLVQFGVEHLGLVENFSAVSLTSANQDGAVRDPACSAVHSRRLTRCSENEATILDHFHGRMDRLVVIRSSYSV